MQARTQWDIFCQIVDNYGDIGVCWRLARQLTHEHQLQIRLWVDDLASFKHLEPRLDPASANQVVDGVEIRHWTTPFQAQQPAQVVIEAFGCNLPDYFINAMSTQSEKPLWINLEYLSAEDWIAEHHALPSPHPRLPLTKYFYFPGCAAESGGLIREAGLLDQRDQFQQDASARDAWWNSQGIIPTPGALTVSLFAYPSVPIAKLLSAWSVSDRPIVCVVPTTPLSAQIASILNCEALQPGVPVQRDNLTLIALPFLSPADYDRLLWACDVNFVRGEDSFVRALWAGKPLIWNIYPQQDEAHQQKLEAFLAIYGEDTPEIQALSAFWHAWNGFDGDLAHVWPSFALALPGLERHAQHWATDLAQQTDLATQLVNLSQKPL